MDLKDLSNSKELDDKAMTEIVGGTSDQANGTSQTNVQSMVAGANVGNASIFSGPGTIQSDNTFTQTASNTNVAENLKALGIVGVPLVPGIDR